MALRALYGLLVKSLTSGRRGLKYESLIAAKAKQRQVAAQNNNAGKAVRENSHEQMEAGRTDETLAQMVGVSSAATCSTI